MKKSELRPFVEKIRALQKERRELMTNTPPPTYSHDGIDFQEVPNRKHQERLAWVSYELGIQKTLLVEKLLEIWD